MHNYQINIIIQVLISVMQAFTAHFINQVVFLSLYIVKHNFIAAVRKYFLHAILSQTFMYVPFIVLQLISRACYTQYIFFIASFLKCLGRRYFASM